MTTARAMVAVPARGFTLLELMVVLTIIGIVFVGAVVLVADSAPDRETATRFQARFALARDRAMMRGETLGLEVWRDGYRFQRLDHDWTWRPMGKGPLGPRSLPPGFHHRLYLDGVAVRLPPEPGRAPQVRILSTGESTPFELAFVGETGEVIIRRDLLGRPVEG